MALINGRLLSHPFNWLYVWITLALFALAWTVISEGLQNNLAPSVQPQS